MGVEPVMLLAFFCLIALASYSVESASVSKKLTKSPTGCPCWFDLEGINEWRHTLSEIGHPCSFDPTRNDCAWCTHDGFQCGNFTELPSASHEHGKYCKRFSHNHKKSLITGQGGLVLVILDISAMV